VSIFDDAHRMPLAIGNCSVIPTTRNADGPALLLPAAYFVGKRVRHRGVIKLRRRLVVPGAPGCPAIHRNERSLVADQQNYFRIVRIDPDVLVVVAAGSAANSCPALASVIGTESHNAGAVNNVRVLRINSRNWQISSTNFE